MREYLDAGGRMQTYREHRLWQAVVRYARELADGYAACLQLCQKAGETGPRQLLPVVAARAMRAHTLELRWALLRYTAVDDVDLGSDGAPVRCVRALRARHAALQDLSGDVGRFHRAAGVFARAGVVGFGDGEPAARRTGGGRAGDRRGRRVLSAAPGARRGLPLRRGSAGARGRPTASRRASLPPAACGSSVPATPAS